MKQRTYYKEDGVLKYTESEAEETSALNVAASYEQRVQQLIREKYSVDEELAIQRQRDTKVEEFKAYFDFCEECKTQAKAESEVSNG